MRRYSCAPSELSHRRRSTDIEHQSFCTPECTDENTDAWPEELECGDGQLQVNRSQLPAAACRLAGRD